VHEQARTAYADAMRVEGRLREPYGGGVLELPGVRLMASGLPFPHYNNACVSEPGLVDIASVREWFAGRGLPWGALVPAGEPWPHGGYVLTKRCMAVTPEDFREAPAPKDVAFVAATADDATDYAAVDAAAFGDPVERALAWSTPRLGAAGCIAVIAMLSGRPAGVATGVLSDGLAGPAVAVFGVGVLPAARGRGIGASLTSYVVSQGFESGARFAHLTPDTETAGRLYARLGFVEGLGMDIYRDV
jgi:ribosomal protein S18 acetylase RimI-like enzyme